MGHNNLFAVRRSGRFKIQDTNPIDGLGDRFRQFRFFVTFHSSIEGLFNAFIP